MQTRGHTWMLLDVEYAQGCAALHLWPDEDSTAPIVLLWPFDRFARGRDADGLRRAAPREWIAATRQLIAGCHPAGGLAGAADAAIDLLPYQLEPAIATFTLAALRILIADEVGLGKTVQAGLIASALCRSRPSARVLVLTPSGLRAQWADELQRLFGLRGIVADSTWIRSAASDGAIDANPWSLPGVLIASHDFIKRPEVLRSLEDLAWDLVIIDEAHACSSRTDRRVAVHAVASRADRVVLLTATPHAGDAREFEALCAIGRVSPAEGPILLFRRLRRDVTPGLRRRTTLLAVAPSAAEGVMHARVDAYTDEIWREARARGDEGARLAAIVLRKRALSSAGSLLASVERRLALLVDPAPGTALQLGLPLGDEDGVEDDEPAASLGAPGLADAARERRWLEAIAEAAARACGAESKMRALDRLLRRLGEPAIVFTEYRDTLVHLDATLAAGGLPRLRLHGGLSANERADVQRSFNAAPAVLLATDAAAEGLNLHTRCRVVIHFELPWNTARLQQRAGRVDRLGQQRPAHEIALVARASAEGLVLEPLIRRATREAQLQGAASGLAAVLAESAVARMVFGEAAPDQGGRDDRGDMQSRPCFQVNLAREAEEETARLRVVRGHVDGTAPRPRPQAPGLTTTRTPPSTHPGLVLVYRLTLTAPDGSRVHEEVVPVRIHDPQLLTFELASRTVRAIVERQSRQSYASLRRVLSTAVTLALGRAAPTYDRARRALRERRDARTHAHARASRTLVQAGLFDGPRPSRHAPGASQSPSVDACPSGRSPSPSILCVDVRLAGALHLFEP